MRQDDNPMQRLSNELANMLAELEEAHATYAKEKEVFKP